MRRILCLLALLPLTVPCEALTTHPSEGSFTVPDNALLPADETFAPPAKRRAFDPWRSTREITFSIGMYMPMQGEEGGAQESFRLDYASFGYRNFGYRVGALYTPQLRGLKGSLGIPVQVAWRTELRGRKRWAENWPEAAASTIQHRGNPLPGLLFILLPQRVEFSGGLTPGWIFGKKDFHLASSPAINHGAWYEEGVLRHHPFTLSVDAEIKLTYRIWRFTLSITPGFHYFLTDNFRVYDTFSGQHTDPGRWYFSLCGGLGFMF